jgi:hypothetical protein
MDLGIAGKKALVCASSKGLGRGCAAEELIPEQIAVDTTSNNPPNTGVPSVRPVSFATAAVIFPACC